jgi:hypothetical protein
VLVFSALLTLSAPATDPTALAGPAPTAAATPPATAVAVGPTAAPSATPPPATLTLSQTVRGVDLALTTTHSMVDDLSVALRDAQGPLIKCAATPAPDADCVLSVRLTMTQLEDNTSNSEDAVDAGGGRYALPTGPYLALDGTWQVVAVVRRYNQPEDIKAAFRYTITGASLTGKVSDYVNVDVSTDPDPPRSGPMALTFHLTDNNGQPVTDATITMQGIMPTHGHVTELIPLQNSAGAYSGQMLMPMSGGWSVDLTITRAGRDTLAAEVDLDLAASSYDLTPYPTPNAPAAPP